MFPLEWRYPPMLLAERDRVAAHGTLRERIRFDLEGRPPYAWGLLTAADAAKFFGFNQITAIEFGVAEGAGLLELCRLASLVTEEAGVSIRVVGFDNGIGLPPPLGFRDHPEIWTEGDFAMGDAEALRAHLPANGELILGDIAQTLPAFLASCPVEAPIAFCSFDLDMHTATVAALSVYLGSAELCLPVGVAYFDDTLGGAKSFGSLCRNAKAGQLNAIETFNRTHALRVIDPIRTLRYRRPLRDEQWLEQVYGVHMLDHPARTLQRRSEALTMRQHGQAPWLEWPA